MKIKLSKIGYALFFTSMALSAHAQEVPNDIQKWFPWVKSRSPQITCPASQVENCIWSQNPTVSQGKDETIFKVVVENMSAESMIVPLPKMSSGYPHTVKVDGKEGILLNKPNESFLVLPSGKSSIEGVFQGSDSSMTIPTWMGATREKRVGGQIFLDGIKQKITTKTSQQEEVQGEESAALKINRLLTDGQVWTISTKLDLEMDGRTKEITIKNLLPPSAVPYSVSGNLNVSKGEGDEWFITAEKAGRYTLDVVAWMPHDGKMNTKVTVSKGVTFNGKETWFVQKADVLRNIEVSCHQVDPKNMQIPAHWKGLQACEKQDGEEISWREIARAESSKDGKLQNLAFVRRYWQSFDGKSAVIADAAKIETSNGARFNQGEEEHLKEGRISNEGVQLTLVDKKAGFSIPAGSQEVKTLSRIEKSGEWVVDITSSPTVKAENNDDIKSKGHMEINLPAGSRLLAVSGESELAGWLGTFNLYGLFFIVLCSIGAWKQWNVKVGAGVFAMMCLASLYSNMPFLTWTAILVSSAIAAKASETKFSLFTKRARDVSLIFGGLLLFGFSYQRFSALIHPSLGLDGQPFSGAGYGWMTDANGDLPGYSGVSFASYVDPVSLHTMSVSSVISWIFLGFGIVLGYAMFNSLRNKYRKGEPVVLKGVLYLFILYVIYGIFSSMLSTSNNAVFGEAPSVYEEPHRPGLGGIASNESIPAPAAPVPMEMADMAKEELSSPASKSLEGYAGSSVKKMKGNVAKSFESRIEISEGVPAWRGNSWSVKVNEGVGGKVTLWMIPAWASRLIGVLIAILGWSLLWTMGKDRFRTATEEIKSLRRN